MEEKEGVKAQRQRRRNAYENKNKGNYERIFPSEEFKPADFERYFKGAKDVYDEFVKGSVDQRNRKEQGDP